MALSRRTRDPIGGTPTLGRPGPPWLGVATVGVGLSDLAASRDHLPRGSDHSRVGYASVIRRTIVQRGRAGRRRGRRCPRSRRTSGRSRARRRRPTAAGGRRSCARRRSWWPTATSREAARNRLTRPRRERERRPRRSTGASAVAATAWAGSSGRHGQRTPLTAGVRRAAPRRARRRWRPAGRAAGRACPAPRCASHASIGPGRGAAAGAQPRAAGRPARRRRALTWPSRRRRGPASALVSLATVRSAPSASGRWPSGVAVVLSTATSAPAACAAAAAGDVAHVQAGVGGRLQQHEARAVEDAVGPRPGGGHLADAAPCARSRASARSCSSRPTAARPRPGAAAASAAATAAMPEANDRHPPPSSSPMAASSARQVGLPRGRRRRSGSGWSGSAEVERRGEHRPGRSGAPVTSAPPRRARSGCRPRLGRAQALALGGAPGSSSP